MITARFVSREKSLNAAFTRSTFSEPSALPARMSADPRSTYLIAAGKIRCTVLLNVTSKAYGGTIRSNVTGRVSPSNKSPVDGLRLASSLSGSGVVPVSPESAVSSVSFPVFSTFTVFCAYAPVIPMAKAIIKITFFMLVVFS